MLEEIMEMELCKFEEDGSKATSDNVEKARNKLSSLMEKIDSIDESLGRETDKVTGIIMASYGEMYFKEGFKLAIRLMNEIKEVL